jgi:hypothetical protein
MTPFEKEALVRELVAELSRLEPAHLNYELMEAYVDGRTDSIDREIVESHVGVCSSCQREVSDLTAFARGFRKGGGMAAALQVAAAIVLLFVGVVVYMRQSVVALSDGARLVRLDRSGRVNGLSGLTDADRQRIGDALKTGVLAVPPAAAQLARSGEALRSTIHNASALEPLAPIGCIIVSDKPTFEWTAIPGARYRVEVFSDQFRPVADSGLLDATRWTAPAPLPRGATYVWQVTAIHGSGQTIAPAPPAPEARFAVLDAPNAQTIARLERMQPRSHLALGVTYARAGATAEAKRELQELADENRDSATASRLLQSLRSH